MAAEKTDHAGGDAKEGRQQTETALLGGGCFWCLEAIFERVPGVQSVTSGFAGGSVASPSYEEVCSGTTGHAEVVEVVFDSTQVSYEELLEVFWQAHDPTQLDRQGADVGTQYRSVIFCHSDAQRRAAERSKARLSASGRLPRPVVTSIEPATDFYPAEAYHQGYYRQNQQAPYCMLVIRPKLAQLGHPR